MSEFVTASESKVVTAHEIFNSNWFLMQRERITKVLI